MNGTLEELSRELSLVCGGARMHAVEASLYVCVCVFKQSSQVNMCHCMPWPENMYALL